MKKINKNITKLFSNVSYNMLPLYCDYSCKYASFPEIDAVGACRREQAVYCKLYKKYNKKQGKCLGNNHK